MKIPGNRLIGWLMSFGLGLFFVTSASAATLKVPAQFATITAAMVQAADGDSIEVSAGVYSPSTNRETFPIVMKSGVTLKGASAGTTVLNAEATAVARVRVINIDSAARVRVTGFTIKGGNVVDQSGGILIQSSSSVAIVDNIITQNRCDGDGGGVMVVDCSAPSIVIANNTISGNQIFNWGGGINCYGASPEITGNTISNNTAGIGGGISCYNTSKPLIAGNTITGNTSDSQGGGIYLHDGCTAFIWDNRITGNKTNGDSGGGIACRAGAVIQGNTISANASHQGGGVSLGSSDTSPDVVQFSNNVIYNNQGDLGAGMDIYGVLRSNVVNNVVYGNTGTEVGAGMYISEGATPLIMNNIVASNLTKAGIETDSGSIPLLSYNDVFNNQAGNYKGVTAGATDLSVNPVFVNPAAGDFTLAASSPCRRTGNPDPAFNNPDRTRNDIGAFGGPTNFLAGDSTTDGIWTARTADRIYFQTYAGGGAICLSTQDALKIIACYASSVSGGTFDAPDVPTGTTYRIRVSFISSFTALYSLTNLATGGITTLTVSRQASDTIKRVTTTDGVWSEDPDKGFRVYFQTYVTGGAILLTTQDALNSLVYYADQVTGGVFKGSDIYNPHLRTAQLVFSSDQAGQLKITDLSSGTSTNRNLTHFAFIK
ncbi:MAG: right-handed parallel beta-helix repeat-containing protein [Deltaproteobacteria bacterium]|nr:right-handed parallel beta-helix repeat-containing protein [Deltaproteobacteria bacterium]